MRAFIKMFLDLDDANAVLVNYFNDELGKVDDETSLDFIQTHAHEFNRFVKGHVWTVVAVHQRHAKVSSVSMRSKWHLVQCRQVVDPVQLSACLFVVTGNQQIYRIRFL